jgi:hypothetical protein
MKKLLLASLCLCGCASQFTAKTSAHYDMGGGKVMDWQTQQDQTGLAAKFDGQTGGFEIKVDKAATPEAAIAAAAETSKILAQVLADLVPLLKAAAAAAGK